MGWCMANARDPIVAAAPVAIRAWVEERIRLGKNMPEDEQIVEALESAEQMREEYVGLHTPGAVKP
jgi:phage-related baseplate assembly protein